MVTNSRPPREGPVKASRPAGHSQNNSNYDNNNSNRHDNGNDDDHHSNENVGAEACLNGRCMFMALGCCFTGFDFDNIMLCSKGNIELLCLTHEHCLAANHDALGIGMLRGNRNECCLLGMFCCTLGCKVPEVCCNGVTQFLCCVQAQAYPFDKETITEPVCAICCYTCKPEPMGCIEPYPETIAIRRFADFTTPASEVITRE